MTSNIARRMMLVVGLAAILGAPTARGDYDLPPYFVGDPTTNSAEWTAYVASEKGLINNDVNFQTMSPGYLDRNYYNTPAHPDGVTLYTSDSSINSVVNGHGPDQSGQLGPTSKGEGQFGGGNYLLSTSPGSSGSSLTIKFAAPVLAVGLATIDYFGSDPILHGGKLTNTLTLSVYDVGGNLLGSATAVRDNFQADNIYFMGYAANADVIGSAVFSRSSDADGDTIGISGIAFATGGGIGTVPEPASLALLTAGGASLAARSARRWRRAA